MYFNFLGFIYIEFCYYISKFLNQRKSLNNYYIYYIIDSFGFCFLETKAGCGKRSLSSAANQMVAIVTQQQQQQLQHLLGNGSCSRCQLPTGNGQLQQQQRQQQQQLQLQKERQQLL